ncbi:MAG: hypothetical protein P4L42_01285 [Desulfocapsaceae bacterium]|nr:hypothetical protein [Desulfocapsaceae bacterium]
MMAVSALELESSICLDPHDSDPIHYKIVEFTRCLGFAGPFESGNMDVVLPY